MKAIDRGATEVQTFRFDADKSLMSSIEIYYKQNQQIVVARKYTPDQMDGDALTVTLTSYDTEKFMARSRVRVQTRVTFLDGTKTVSDIKTFMVKDSIGDNNDTRFF